MVKKSPIGNKNSYRNSYRIGKWWKKFIGYTNISLLCRQFFGKNKKIGKNVNIIGYALGGGGDEGSCLPNPDIICTYLIAHDKLVLPEYSK
jgi:hypothetical protein